MTSKGAKLKEEKLRAIKEKKRAIMQEKAEKVSPPLSGPEFIGRADGLGPDNVSRLGGFLSLQPWLGMCSLPINVNPYRGCSNNCSYCFINQFNRGNIGRKPGIRERKFYGAMGSPKPLEEMLQLSQGRRKLADLPKGRQI